MSDIALPPGIGVLLIAIWLLGLSLIGAIVFLIVAAFTQKALPFRLRRAFSLFLGMLFPLGLGVLGIGVARFGPLGLLRAIDESPVVAGLGALFVFGWGILWGARRRAEDKVSVDYEDDD